MVKSAQNCYKLFSFLDLWRIISFGYIRLCVTAQFINVKKGTCSISLARYQYVNTFINI